jgi:HAD superfamily hydrolase (TIGR01549 family)
MSDQIICQIIYQSKIIFFDHDDTLVGTIRAKWAQHKYIARQFYGKKLSDKELRAHWGKPLTLLLKSLYETDRLNIAMFYNVATRNEFPKLLFEDTLATLTSLRAMGKKLGIVTATSLSSLQNDFNTLGISQQFFDYIQTEDDTVFHKPNPRVFEPALKWLKKHAILPSEVVYVGDHLKDQAAAKGAGLNFIGVATGLVSFAEFVQHQIPCINRLSSLIESFNG